MRKEVCTAIVLAAGQGKRMGSKVQKQYIELAGKPVIYYTLKTFQDSSVIDRVIMVVGEGQEVYAREEIVEKYGFSKVGAVIAGGKERYDSVWNGLCAIKDMDEHADNFPADNTSYVFIHDGARLLVTEDILVRGLETVRKYGACVAGMPSKDTVRIVDEECMSLQTPSRKYVWNIQTPQIFEKDLITEAYRLMMESDHSLVTDDASAIELMLHKPVKMYEGSYSNIKITTPEDLDIAARFLKL
ncbi:MAG: 2-C-methyl-D-erythritol 4-phosphate cytidylyltransferase [Dorea sp.]|nr:2-C-methyl-D-erythritol 4-phosphate cytidylyltransferase [Dorea sp.]